jgi:hypothetical protein
MFRTQHKNELKYYNLNASYNVLSSDKLYLDVEYYIANTTNPLIKNAVKDQQSLAFSLEDRSWNDRAYNVIRIFQTFDNKQTTLQWLFVSQETFQIYEYDLPNDTLKEFK